MPSRRVLAGAVVALVALAGLLLVPRGGDGGTLSKPEYEQKVRTEYAKVQDAFRKTNVTSPSLLAERVAEAQSELILGHWWQLAAATIFMAVFVTAFSLMTDSLRDALDPKLRGLE